MTNRIAPPPMRPSPIRTSPQTFDAAAEGGLPLALVLGLAHIVAEADEWPATVDDEEAADVSAGSC